MSWQAPFLSTSRGFIKLICNGAAPWRKYGLHQFPDFSTPSPPLSQQGNAEPGTAENGKPWLLLSWWWGFVRSKHWHSDAPVRRALAAEATPGWWQASGRVHPFPEEQGSRSLPALPSRLVYIPAGSGWAGVSQCKTVSEKTSPASPPT